MNEKTSKTISVMLICLACIMLFCGWITVSGISNEAKSMVESTLENEMVNDYLGTDESAIVSSVKDLSLSPVELFSLSIWVLGNSDDLSDSDDGKAVIMGCILYIVMLVLLFGAAVLAICECLGKFTLKVKVSPFLLLMGLFLLADIILCIYMGDKMDALSMITGYLRMEGVDIDDIGIRPTLWAFLAVLFAVPFSYYSRLIEKNDFGRKAVTSMEALGTGVAAKAKDMAGDVKKYAVQSKRWTCPVCGNETDRGGKFCPRCGSERSEDPEPRFCYSCGAKLKEGDMFCEKCGAKAISAETEPSADGAGAQNAVLPTPETKPSKPAQNSKAMRLRITAEEAEAGAVKKFRLSSGEVKQLKIPAGVTNGKRFKVKSDDGDVIIEIGIK